MNEDQCFLQLRPDKSGILSLLVQVVIWFELVIAAGLSRPGKSREGPEKVPGRDRTGPRDIEGPVVPEYSPLRCDLGTAPGCLSRRLKIYGFG